MACHTASFSCPVHCCVRGYVWHGRATHAPRPLAAMYTARGTDGRVPLRLAPVLPSHVPRPPWAAAPFLLGGGVPCAIPLRPLVSLGRLPRPPVATCGWLWGVRLGVGGVQLAPPKSHPRQGAVAYRPRWGSRAAGPGLCCAPRPSFPGLAPPGNWGYRCRRCERRCRANCWRRQPVHPWGGGGGGALDPLRAGGVPRLHPLVLAGPFQVPLDLVAGHQHFVRHLVVVLAARPMELFWAAAPCHPRGAQASAA